MMTCRPDQSRCLCLGLTRAPLLLGLSLLLAGLLPLQLPLAQVCSDCDGDGVARPVDCNDADAAVFPGAAEVCNGRDDDCNGLADDGAGCTRICSVPDAVWPTPLVSAGNAEGPSIVWTGAQFGVAYTDAVAGQILFLRLDPSGQPIGSPLLVSTHAPIQSIFSFGKATPSLVWNGTQYAVVWHDAGELRFARLDAAGQLIDTEMVFLSCTAPCEQPSMVWTGEEYGVIWRDERDGIPDNIFFTRLAVDGTPLSAAIKTTDKVFNRFTPHLAWSGTEFGFPFVKGSHITFRRLAADGTPLGLETPITVGSFFATEPDIVWADDRWALVWRGSPGGVSGAEVFLTFVDASGNKSTGNIQITDLPGVPTSIRITWTGQEYGVIWSGNHHLTFERIDSGGLKIGGDTKVDLAPTSSSDAAMVWTGSRYQLAFREFRGQQSISLHDLGLGSLRCDCSVNQDGDQASSCSDCDDLTAAVFPGAPPVCDLLNNDCTDAAWPSIVGTNEVDDDLDGFSECNGDCDDILGNIFPGAAQVCDGVANDCDQPGWPSLQGLNETGDCLIDLRVDLGGSLSWQSPTPFGLWNAYRGDMDILRQVPPNFANPGQWTQALGSSALVVQDCALGHPLLADNVVLVPGEIAFFLVTGLTGTVESSLGQWIIPTLSGNRLNGQPCP